MSMSEDQLRRDTIQREKSLVTVDQGIADVKALLKLPNVTPEARELLVRALNEVERRKAGL